MYIVEIDFACTVYVHVDSVAISWKDTELMQRIHRKTLCTMLLLCPVSYSG